MTLRTPLTATLLLVSLAGVACSGATSPDAGSGLTVSFSAQAPVSSSELSFVSVSSRAISVSSGSDVLAISRIQLVLARMELFHAGGACDSGENAGDDTVDEHACAELELAPSLVDLPVDGALAGVLSVDVPPGDYAALEAKVRAVRAGEGHGEGSQAFLAAHPELAGVSVVVTGTFNGVPFTWTGAPRAEFETSFSPTLAVDDAPVNLTVHADVTTWFKTQSGTVIDPATANPGGPNAGLVTDNIRRSFKAFRDDDRNGHDDGDDHAHA